MIEKLCSRCKLVKDITQFSRDKQHHTGYKSTCKDCAKQDFKQWRQKNIQNVKLQDKIKQYKRKYNLSDTLAKQLAENRTGICKICGEVLPLVVDHCHTTGKVRGFVCSACNSLLGYSKDNINTLTQAIKYLKDFYD